MQRQEQAEISPAILAGAVVFCNRKTMCPASQFTW